MLLANRIIIVRISALLSKATEEEKDKSEKELLNVQKLKSYKDLLDSGVITQEEFDKKKSELLDL